VLAALETPTDPAPALGSLQHHRDATARLTRFAEVVAFLGRRASGAPVALLFDDIHASDPSSLQLLEYALPMLLGKKVLVALAARDADAPPDVAAALAGIQRRATRIPLARLRAADVHELVGVRADGDRVYELSDGNPLFVEELVAAQQTRGVLGLPPLSSVRTVIRDRVAGLPERTQRALRCAAAVGRDFRGRVVAEMLGEGALASVLEPACALGIVATTGMDGFRFSHALVAESLCDDLSADDRARLHVSAARAIERWIPDDVGAIAHQLLAAGELSGVDAVAAAERAAARCMAQLAFEDAAALLGQAIDALGVVAPDDTRRRAELLCARAESLQHATQHAAAALLCDEAAALVRSPGAASDTGASALFARIALARGLEFRFGRTDPLLVALLREALERLGGGPLTLRAKLLARLAAAEQPAPDPREPMARALEAIELARSLPSRDRLEITYVATAALVDYAEPSVLTPILNDALGLARGMDRWITVHTRLRLCFAALLGTRRGDFEAAKAAFVAEARALGLPRWTRHEHMLDALTALLEGRFADAEASADRFDAVSAELGDSGSGFITDVHRAMVAWVRTAPLEPAVRARLAAYVPGRAAIAAWFAHQDGSVDGVRTALAELGDRVPLDPDLCSMVASAAAFVKDRGRARAIHDVLAPRSGGIVLTSMVGAAVMDLVDRLLLVLATAMEGWETIDAHAAAALAVAAALGSPVWTARVQADWADALDRRGRPGDPERAAELRNEARKVAERLSMPGLLDRCKSRRERTAAAPVPAAQASSGAPLEPLDLVELTRHGELWTVRGFGEQVHVKDSRGMQMIARLVAEPGAPLHALDLGGAAGPSDGGDAGPALDARARAEYRARFAELVAERDEAEGLGDLGRVERAAAELEAIGAELERAFGIGGRERRVGAATERARTNVQRRIAHALEQVRSASRRIGEHLTASIRTGTYCSYDVSSQDPSRRSRP
jgi:hypothetical protein